LRTAKYNIYKKSIVGNDTTYLLGGRQILFYDRRLLLICEDSKTGLKCNTLRL